MRAGTEPCAIVLARARVLLSKFGEAQSGRPIGAAAEEAPLPGPAEQTRGACV